jgi:hypothetical protein
MALGLVLPAAMLVVGELLLAPDSRIPLPPVDQLCIWIAAQVLVTSVAVYAASVSGNTLRAILTAFAIIAVGWIALALEANAANKLSDWLMSTFDPGMDVLPHSLVIQFDLIPLLVAGGLLVLCCLMQRLAWPNFPRQGLPARQLFIQFASILFTVWLLPLIGLALLFILSGN